MAGGAPPPPSGGIGLPGGAPPRRNSGSGFSWSAPLPSSEEVAGLERMFPEVIQLPMADIDRESEDWSSSGVILRPLSRWVPLEAILREFRRAGLAGKIDAISLAYRTFLLKFELPEARSAALMQPWVVNGQPLAVEPWRPDFVPAENALLSALLWIRLQNLPIEYWQEETLRSIVSVAGQFVGADAFTKDRKRGNYARVCARVDLSKPLRPGARFRGRGSPFWLQFAYEHVDCICQRCGSLHLSGPCSSSLEPGSSAAAPKYGPWMAALRFRKVASSSVNVGASAGLASADGVLGAAQAGGSGDNEGWRVPRKIARRRPGLPISSSPNSASVHDVQLSNQDLCQETLSVPVTVHPENELTVDPVGSADGNLPVPSSSKSQKAVKGRKGKSSTVCQTDKANQNESVFQFSSECSVDSTPKSQGSLRIDLAPQNGSQRKQGKKVSANPFSMTGSDRWAGRPKVRMDANPGSLKRARAVEVMVPSFSPKDQMGIGRASSAELGPTMVAETPKGTGPSQGVDDHESAVLALKSALAGSPSVALDGESLIQPVSQLSDQGNQMQCTVAGVNPEMVLMGDQN